ncbi:MAG: hypothetical protein ACRDAV_00300, partial [Plesiomonas shigelloides]
YIEPTGRSVMGGLFFWSSLCGRLSVFCLLSSVFCLLSSVFCLLSSVCLFVNAFFWMQKDDIFIYSYLFPAKGDI